MVAAMCLRTSRCFGLIVAVMLLSACGDDENSTASQQGSTATGTVVSAPLPPTTPAESLTIKGTPPTTVEAGSSYSFQPTVSLSSTMVTFAVSGQPAWARFDPSTGKLSGTPAVANEGTTGHIVITARNDTASASLSAFTIRINSPGVVAGAAKVSWVAPTENSDGSPITDLAGYHVYYGTSADELTQTVTVAGAQATSFILEGLAEGTYYFSVVAYNTDGQESSRSSIVDQTI